MPCTVKLSDSEFHTEIDPAAKKFTNGGKGRDSRFTLFVALRLKDMFKTLQGMNDYVHLFLTDAVMGIDDYGESIGDYDMDSTTRAEYCCRFRFALSRRAQFCVHVYGINNPQKNLDCIFL